MDGPQQGQGARSLRVQRLPTGGAAGDGTEPGYILPLRVTGPTSFNLLAVWAQNASAGIVRKREQGPLRRALTQYRSFLSEGPTVMAGDWNSIAIWDKPGWRINHMTKVGMLARQGLVRVYHAWANEAHGEETEPTLYWRDRKRDGPTYHIDFVFVPHAWIRRTAEFHIRSFEHWCGSGLSDHSPVTAEFALQTPPRDSPTWASA